MLEDKSAGWWDMPALTHWKCAVCRLSTPVEDWKENRPPCEDCGDHDGRECPRCGAVFDHVWGAERLAQVQDKP